MILAEKQRISEQLYNTVEPSRKTKRGLIQPLYLVIGICLGLIVANLWVQIALVKRNEELRDCQQAIRALERESIQIRVEMAKLESFNRIQGIAQKELGMRVAGPNDYQCIAAAPSINKDQPRPYNFTAQTNPQNNRLWAKVASWFDGIRTAMAQSE